MSKRPTLIDRAIADIDAQIDAKLAEIEGLKAGRQALVNQQLHRPAKQPPAAK